MPTGPYAYGPYAYPDGCKFNGDILYKVPVVYLPDRNGVEIGRLDNRTLDRIIRPTLDSVNKYALFTNMLGPTIGTYLEVRFMTSGWESYFGTINTSKWFYGGQVFSNWDINYIVGGYAAKKSVRGNKPWGENVVGTYYWFLVGYSREWLRWLY